MQGSLTGTIAATLSARLVRLTAAWTESVSYTDHETSQESYEEAYRDTEWYWDRVHHTNSDGTTTSRSEHKSRTVTKHRTAYRSVTKAVTKHRDEPRTFEYGATHREGHYASAFRLDFDGALRDLVPNIASDLAATGIDHDVTHAPSGVSPRRANLMTFVDFVAREQHRMRARVLTALGEHYRFRFCTALTFTLDAAAACAFFDPKDVPGPVHAALRAMFGPDEAFAMAALGR